MTGSITLRTCNVCLIEKPLTDFYPYKSPWNGEPRWTRKCKVCQTKYRQDRRNRDKATYNKQTQQRRNENKLRAIEYKGGCCKDCKGTFPPYVYDFHHLDPKEKEGTLGTLLHRTFENCIVELDKCVLLCANCHRIRHFVNEVPY